MSKKTMIAVACAAFCALGALAARAAADSPWGWACYTDGTESLSLTNRTAAGGISLDDADLPGKPSEIRFAAGTFKVDHLCVADRFLTFAGHADGTVLKQHPAVEREYGGAIYAEGGSIVVTNLVFDGFSVLSEGGALSLEGMEADAAILDCRFVNCRAAEDGGVGGAVYVSSWIDGAETLEVRRCTFDGCRAAAGGAIASVRIYPFREKSTSLVIADSTFRNNAASYSGGALWVEGDTSFAQTLFEGNKSGSDGGAVCAGSIDVDYAGSVIRSQAGVVFRNNVAHEDAYGWACGGAVAIMSGGFRFFAERTAFLTNVCDLSGGAVFASTNDVVGISTCIFSNNVVTAQNEGNYGFGGALSAEHSAVGMTNVTVRGSNYVAVDFYDTTAEIVNCAIIGNADGDVSCTDGPFDPALYVSRSAYGSLFCEETVSLTTNQCLAGRTDSDYDGATLLLKGTSDYNPVAAEGIVQTAKDFADVDYGFHDYGYSMGAYECATVAGISSEPYSGKYDGLGHEITVKSQVAVVPLTWSYATNALGPWVDAMPAYTNVGVYWVWARASSDVFKNPMVTSNTVTITDASFDFRLDTYNNAYDGVTHAVSAVIEDAKVAAEATVWYRTSETAEWSLVQPTFTDVTNATVCVKVTTLNYGERIRTNDLHILKRKISIGCPAASKPYDGHPLQLNATRLAIGEQGYAPNECFKYVFPSITEVGWTWSTVDCLDNDATTPKTKVSNYEILSEVVNTLTVTPSAKEIGVASKSFVWTYDGNAHWLKEYESSNLGNLIAGDKLDVTLEGTQITYPGSTNNAILAVRVMRGDEDVTASYGNIVVTTGALKVVNAKFEDVTASGVSRKYDGTATNIVVAVKDTLAKGWKVEYSYGGSDWSEVNPTFTDAGTYVVQYKVSAKYFDDYTGSATVTIAPREVTFTSPSSNAVYHAGIALSTDADHIKISGDGMVKGELKGVTFVGTKTIYNAGDKADATFSYAFDEVKAKAQNYAVTPVYGTLQIFSQDTLIVTSGTQDFTYDGDEQWCKTNTYVGALREGDKIDATYLKSITYPRQSPVSNDISVRILRGLTDVTHEYTVVCIPGELTMKKLPLEGLVSAKDVLKVYDGVATNITVKVDESKLIEGATYEIEYKKSSADSWNKTNPTFFRGRTDQEVAYRVTSSDYETLADAATVKIALRKVKVVSGSGTWDYDGDTHVNHEVTVQEGDGLYGPAYGEFFDYTVTGSARDVGTVDNLFDCVVTNVAGTVDLAFNYDFEKVPGKLKINAGDLPFELNGFDDLYDGKKHGPDLKIGTLIPGTPEPKVQYSPDGGKTWLDEPPTYKDVTNVTVIVKIETPNYNTVTVKTKINVKQRDLLLEAPDLKHPYNGEALTFTGADINAGGSQYADGECFDYSDFASITEVGRIPSTFKYADSATAKVSNYKVSVVPNRWLEVLPDASKIVVRSFSYYGKYDGKPHGAGCEVIDNGKLVPGDSVEAILAGKTVTCPADGIVSNVFSSVKILRGTEDVTDSYTNLVRVIGTLQVVPADFGDGDVEAVGVDRKYDGTAAQVRVTVKNALAESAKIFYATDGERFDEVNPTFTNACDATVTYVVTDPNFNPYTNAVAAKIAKRTVCFKSRDDWKFFDGTPLTVRDENIVPVAGYDGFVGEEGVKEFTDKASITQKGWCEATFGVSLKDNTLVGNYTVKTVFGRLDVYTSDGLVIVAGSEEFAYDGSSHDCHTCAFLNVDKGDKLLTNDFVYVGAIRHPDQSPVANWIRRESVKVVNAGGKDVTAKYGAFTLIEGKLTMEPLSLDDCVSAEDVYKVYDGAATNVTVKVDTSKLPAEAAASVRVHYSNLPNAAFGNDNLYRTKSGTYDVYYYASASGCVDSVVRKATISIATRKIQLTSAGAAKVYDGEPLTTNEVACAKGEGLYDLAPGDCLKYGCYGSQTDVGDSENRFTFAITNAANDASLNDNYFVTFSYGKLVVTAAEQEFTDPAEGYDYIGMYDGEGHTVRSFTVTKPTDAKTFYSTNGVDWSEEKFYMTNVCTAARVWLKSVAPNYVDVVTNGCVTITNRPVTVKSASGSYVYDGAAHGTNDFSVTGGSGFVKGEGITGRDYATITAVRDSPKDNTFGYDFNAGTKAENYLISQEFGTLTMVPGNPPKPEDDDPANPPPPPPTPEDPYAPKPPQDPETGDIATFSDYDYVGVYDGDAHTLLTNRLWDVINRQVADGKWPGDKPTVTYSLDGAENSWVADPYAFTDVVSTGFWYRVGCENGNFSNVVHAVGVTITQRVVTVVFPLAKKTFDGTVDFAGTLTTNAVRGTHNMVKDEVFFAEAWGKFSQPDVGDRTFMLTNVAFTAQSGAKFGNYRIYFGANGVLFNPDNCVGPGPVPFGPDDPNWPKAPEDQPTTPGKIENSDLPPFDPPPPDEPPFLPDVGPFPGPDLPEDTPLPPPYDPNDPASVTNRLSNYDYITVYDGAGHTLKVADLNRKLADLGVANPTVEYSTTGVAGSWVTEPFSYTNVVGTSFWYRVSAPNYNSAIHAVGVTITQRVVRVVFPTAVKTFDGTKDLPAPLVTNLSTEAQNMVAGERFDALGYGRFDDASAGSRTLTLTNVTITAANEATRFGNYKIYFGADGDILFNPKDGTEGPGPHSFGPQDKDPEWPSPGDPELDLPGEIFRQDGITFDFTDDAANRYYKAEGWEPPVEVRNAAGVVVGEDEYAVAYYTNVHATVDAAYAVVSMTNNYVGIVTNHFGIRVRPLSVVTEGTNFVFNGGWQSNAVVAITGLAGGEGKDFVVTNSFTEVRDVTSAPVDNVFGFALGGVCRAGDYDVTTTWGKLTVVPAKAPPAEEDTGKHPKPPVYDPKDPAPPPAPVDEKGDPVTFSDYDFVGPYDGEAHTLNTNALIRAVQDQVDRGEWLGATPTIAYSLDGIHWQPEPFCFTDATATSFWYKVSAPNFADFVHAVGVTVTPREITLRSLTIQKYLPPKGGTVIASNGVAIVEVGEFVGDDYFVATVPTYLKSDKEAGPIDNLFDVRISPGRAENYAITKTYGKLQIMTKPAGNSLIIKEVLDKTSRDIITLVMDNLDAGPWAADMPPELDALALTVDKNSADKVEIRVKISEDYDEAAFAAVTNAIVRDAREKARPEKEIRDYRYEGLDITIHKRHDYYDKKGGAITNSVTTNIGNDIDELLTIVIPHEFSSKLLDFSVWRRHEYTEGATTRADIAQLNYGKGNADPVTGEYYTTNDVGVALCVKKLSVYVFKSLYLSTPMLTGTLGWKYHQAQDAFFAGLDVVCTNGDATAIQNLKFVLEDGTGSYLRSLTGSEKLSDTSWAYYGGKKFGAVALDDVAGQLRAAPLGTTFRTGVSSATMASSRYVVPVAERVIALASTTPGRHRDPTVAALELPGYLTWQEEGSTETHWCAVGPNAEAINALAQVGMRPLTTASISEAVSMGLLAADGFGGLLGTGDGGTAQKPDVDAAAVYKKTRNLATAVVIEDGTGAYVGTAKVSLGKIRNGEVKLTVRVTPFSGKAVTAKQNLVIASDGSGSGSLSFKDPFGTMVAVLDYDAETDVCHFDAIGNGYRIVTSEGDSLGGAFGATELKFSVDLSGLVMPEGFETVDEALPDGEPIHVSGGTKWKFDKAATLKFVLDKETGEYSLSGLDGAGGKTNLSGLKLNYAAKTGLFTGSFKVYATDEGVVEGGKKPTLKKYAAKVKGVVVNGVGCGLVTVKVGKETYSGLCTVEE